MLDFVEVDGDTADIFLHPMEVLVRGFGLVNAQQCFQSVQNETSQFVTRWKNGLSNDENALVYDFSIHKLVAGRQSRDCWD